MDVLGVAAAADGRPDLTASVAELGNLRMTNLLVEGGQAIHGTFHDAGLIDEVYAFIAPKTRRRHLGSVPDGGGEASQIPETGSLRHVELQTLGGGVHLCEVTRIPE